MIEVDPYISQKFSEIMNNIYQYLSQPVGDSSLPLWALLLIIVAIIFVWEEMS